MNTLPTGYQPDQALYRLNRMKALVAVGLALLLLVLAGHWGSPAGAPSPGSAAPAPSATTPAASPTAAPAATPTATPSAAAGTAPASAAASASSAASVTGAPALLQLLREGNQYKLAGDVASDADKAAALAAARQAFGADRVTEALQVRPGAGKAEWMELRGQTASEAERASTEAAVRKAFGDAVRVDNRIVLAAPAAESPASPTASPGSAASAGPAAMPPASASNTKAAAECAAPLDVRLGFYINSSSLLIPDRARLDRLVRCRGNGRIEIEGHSDNAGDEPTNQQLSLVRAERVKAYLLARGVPADRITTTSLGSTKPIAGNDSAEGRQQNRRVEVMLK